MLPKPPSAFYSNKMISALTVWFIVI